jgi:hypothetical protein
VIIFFFVLQPDNDLIMVETCSWIELNICYFDLNTGHTQNNGEVLIVNTIKTAPFFCVCPVYWLCLIDFLIYPRLLKNEMGINCLKSKFYIVRFQVLTAVSMEIKLHRDMEPNIWEVPTHVSEERTAANFRLEFLHDAPFTLSHNSTAPSLMRLVANLTSCRIDFYPSQSTWDLW